MFYKDLYYKKMNNNQCMLNKIFFLQQHIDSGLKWHYSATLYDMNTFLLFHVVDWHNW